jgi:nucleoid-associated protein YgaU
LNLIPTPAPVAAAIVPTPTSGSNEAVEYTPTVELPASYTVVQGDNIGKIAQKMYGKYSLWPHIRDANTQILGSNIDLSIGMELTIPKL